MSREEKYTLITGASAGIGEAMAVECAKKGMNLLLVALPGPDLETLGNSIKKTYGVEVHCLGLDMLADDAPLQVSQWREAERFRVNMLINNIGLGGRSNFEQTRAADFQQMLRMNVDVGTGLSHYLIGELKRHAPAYILNMASTAAFFPIPYKAVYSATKAYIYAFSRALYNELKPSGIHVAVVCPGGADNKADEIVRKNVNGFVFRSFHHTREYIARSAIDGLLKKKRVIIPGRFPKFYTYFSRCLPSAWTDRVVQKLFT